MLYQKEDPPLRKNFNIREIPYQAKLIEHDPSKEET